MKKFKNFTKQDVREAYIQAEYDIENYKQHNREKFERKVKKDKDNIKRYLRGNVF